MNKLLIMRITRFKCWLGATLLYGYLFYDQSAGVNFLLFNVALLAALFALYPTLRRQRTVAAMATGCLLTALNVVWHPTWPAILMNSISLLGLAGLSAHPENSLLVAWINSGYSLVASFWKNTLGRINPQPALVSSSAQGKTTPPATAGITAGKVVSQLVPLLVVALFFLLYTQASPAFSALFSHLSLDFISVWWVIFTLFGGYLLLAFFYPTAIRPLVRVDLATANELTRQRQPHPYGFNPVGLRYEYRSAWWLFVMLNGLLFVFNAVDIYYLTTARLPEGITHAAFVHQGVNTLITSVVLAIAVVMYFFRGNLNFLKKGEYLRIATYLWIAQNAVLIGATASKNFSYIAEYGLTYKRVGVYLYLLLTLIGLITTYIKVREVKTNWFLLRKNAWLFYAVLVLFSTVDWSRAITRYNLAYLSPGKVDTGYLLSLPDTNLDLLERAPGLSRPQADLIRDRVSYFIRRENQEDWLSWNYADHLVYQRLHLSEPLPDAY